MGDDMPVDIDAMTYTLVEHPPSSSQEVKKQREILLGEIDLKTLVQDLGQVGMCIRVAYNGVMAAGPKFTGLQIEVQDLGYDVTKLCDKSAITVAKFKRACETVLGDLITTYEYLLDNFEVMALDTLASVSELAGKMAAAAQKLHNDFDEQALKVRKVAKKTKRTHGDQARLVEEKGKEELELKKKQEEQEVELTKARQAEEYAEQLVREYEMKEDKAIESLGDEGNALVRVVNGLTSKYLGTRVIGEDLQTREQKVRLWKEKKLEALKCSKQQTTMRREAYQKLTAFAVKIGRCTGEKEMAAAAVNALHEAMSGLQELAALMMRASVFWKQMQEHCKALGEDKMKHTVEKAMDEFDDAKRRKLWTSSAFKRQALRFHAGWVALNDVCGEYMHQIQETQRDLYKYITENPTFEEAEVNVKKLAAKFEKDLKEAQKAIKKKESEEEEEIRSLQEDKTES